MPTCRKETMTRFTADRIPSRELIDENRAAHDL